MRETQRPGGSEYWERGMKDALVPGPAVPEGLTGTVASSESADHPMKLVLAMSDQATAEATIRISSPLKTPFPRGTVAIFQGVAEEFSRDPFMLTFDVAQDGPTFVRKESR